MGQVEAVAEVAILDEYPEEKAGYDAETAASLDAVAYQMTVGNSSCTIAFNPKGISDYCETFAAIATQTDQPAIMAGSFASYTFMDVPFNILPQEWDKIDAATLQSFFFAAKAATIPRHVITCFNQNLVCCLELIILIFLWWVNSCAF
jgi:hypothetical protein